MGVSKDSLKSHEKFIEEIGISFVLLSDEEGTMLDDYGVFVEKTLDGEPYMGIQRTTFLINPEGVIQKIYDQPDTATNADDVLSDLRAMQG